MMIRNLMFATLAISMFATSAQSDPVNAANVTTFQANTPAVAADVNGTFQALITAINDNATRIADLEAAVPSNDVAGQSYFVVELEVGAVETLPSPDVSSIGSGFSFSGIITFGQAGTGSIAGTEFEFEHGPGLGVTSLQAAGSTTFTFTQTGSVVTITDDDDGDVFVLQASQSGEILSGSSIDTEVSPNVADTNVLIAIRQ